MGDIRVSLGARSYPIHIGAGILDAPAFYRNHLQEGSRAAIVTNSVVEKLYLERLVAMLGHMGVGCVRIVLPDGEQHKTWKTLDRVVDELLAARCDRKTCVIALGGGVIGDLAGFAAAVYQRGVPFIQVPTTLLAQVDSSVGGKTAVNHARGKNMVGAFYQPRAVISDVTTLDTLPERELRAGLAEVIKHGLILDADFVAWLELHLDSLLAREPGALEYAVRRCCELKAGVVGSDEREEGLRAILNFGHTFGHAIEAATGYGTWLHGEAIAAGMVMAAHLSSIKGLISAQDAARVRTLLSRAGLPTTGPALSFETYLEHMAVDKKAAAGRVRFVLLEKIGGAQICADIDEGALRESIRAGSPSS